MTVRTRLLVGAVLGVGASIIVATYGLEPENSFLQRLVINPLFGKD